jgi:hypothetical protein
MRAPVSTTCRRWPVRAPIRLSVAASNVACPAVPAVGGDRHPGDAGWHDPGLDCASVREDARRRAGARGAGRVRVDTVEVSIVRATVRTRASRAPSTLGRLRLPSAWSLRAMRKLLG